LFDVKKWLMFCISVGIIEPGTCGNPITLRLINLGFLFLWFCSFAAQAYTMELEYKVQQLEQENTHLVNEEVRFLTVTNFQAKTK